jgi:uracil-DNA glycosylase family protein
LPLPVLAGAIRQCRACDLCARSTGPVWGEGDPHSRIMLVGEQPGDEEDRQGRPFVGPAGQVLDAALREAGIERPRIYLTNAVKSFRFEERGKRRIHKTPGATHIAACRPWLKAEIEAVQPQSILCLGASAAQAVLGRKVHIGAERGGAGQVRVTYHPSAILRAPDPVVKEELTSALVSDLRNLLTCK